MKLQKIIIFFLSISTVTLGFLYFKVKNQNKHFTESKNNKFEWKNGDEILNSYWKKNDKLASQFFDQNFDNNYEIIRTFTTYGKLYQTSFDRNENGVYEKVECFNITGEKVGEIIDYDEDGIPEEFSLFINSVKKLKFKDENYDGIFEKLTITNDSIITETLTEKIFDK
ncbi:hypothetical protein EV195_1251 [Tenacibaculum skagerrakense]|uniref:MORN repeat protein n=1 Tax=Tenacibaculum skagerrakense TaxID=186571 RepID=A0A4R2NI22_9FLAO|nr:hypothetical protein [Tenacibaculum skagerrakense]TCP21047.1 hypothetical protein EV195_1251 [Tenacibaculum skagerrakense]